MDNLQELQHIWQNQPDRDFKVDNYKISDTILERIKNTESKIFRINMVKTVAVSMLILNFIWIFYKLKDISIFSWLGVGCIAIGTLVFMIVYWKIQFRSSSLSHDLPQNDFINDTISQMKEHKKRFVKLFRWFVLLITVGINLFYIDLLMNEDFGTRLIFHVGITCFLVITFLLGLKFRDRRFKKEFQPLIDELELIKE